LATASGHCPSSWGQLVVESKLLDDLTDDMKASEQKYSSELAHARTSGKGARWSLQNHGHHLGPRQLFFFVVDIFHGFGRVSWINLGPEGCFKFQKAMIT